MEVRHLGTLLYASLKQPEKMPMSIGITILTGSNSPMMTAQVNIYLCVGCVRYTEKEVLLTFTCANQNSKMKHNVKVV